MGHRLRPVQHRLRELVEQRRHVRRGLLGLAEMAPEDAAGLAQVDLLGEGRARRHRHIRKEAVKVPRSRGQKLAVGREDLGAVLDRPQGRTGEDGPHLVQPEEEGGDDSEVATTAAQRPEEVGVRLRGGGHSLSAGEDDVSLQQVVDREAELPGQMAEAAAQREAADTRGADDAAGGREAVLAGRRVDFLPDAAATDPRGPGARVHLYPLKAGEVDHQAVVAGTEAAAIVAAAANRKQNAPLARERHGTGDVVGVGDSRDQPGAAVDHRVVDAARLFVARVSGRRQHALEVRHLAAGVVFEALGCAHGHLLCGIVISRSRLGRDSRSVMTGSDSIREAPGEGSELSP